MSCIKNKKPLDGPHFQTIPSLYVQLKGKTSGIINQNRYLNAVLIFFEACALLNHTSCCVSDKFGNYNALLADREINIFHGFNGPKTNHSTSVIDVCAILRRRTCVPVSFRHVYIRSKGIPFALRNALVANATPTPGPVWPTITQASHVGNWKFSSVFYENFHCTFRKRLEELLGCQEIIVRYLSTIENSRVQGVVVKKINDTYPNRTSRAQHL